MDSYKYDQVVLNLKILGMVPRNGRIKRSDNGSITLENDDILVPVKRYIFNNGRKQSLIDINIILEEAFSLIKIILLSKRIVDNKYQVCDDNRQLMSQLNVIYNELKKSKKGIENLQNTYKDDIKTCASFDLMFEKINFNLMEINRKIDYENVDI
jgi:hypothetical protein